MKLKVILTIALKNLLRKKSRAFVTIAALSVAISLVVVLVSLGYGLQEMVISNFTTLESLRTIDVTPEKSQQIVLDETSLERMQELDSVDSVLPVVELGARIRYENSVTDVALVGLSGETFDRWVSLNIDDTSQLDYFFGNKVILGQDVLTLLGITDGASIIGNSVELQISFGSYMDIEVEDEAVEPLTEVGDSVNLTDSFDVLTFENNSTSPIVFVPIEYLIQNGLIRYSLVKVVTKSASDVASTRLLLEKMGYKTSTSQDIVDQIIEIFNIVRIGLSTFGIVAGVVAALGMFNTLTVSLMEKTREIGILKALGAQRGTVLILFLSEAVIISITGSVLGIVVGLLTSGIIQLVMSTMAKIRGYSLEPLFSYPPLFLVFVFLLTILVGFLTGFYPARKAAAVNTLDALRYE